MICPKVTCELHILWKNKSFQILTKTVLRPRDQIQDLMIWNKDSPDQEIQINTILSTIDKSSSYFYTLVIVRC